MNGGDSPPGEHAAFSETDTDTDNMATRTSRDVQESLTSLFPQQVHLKQSACHLFDRAITAESCHIHSKILRTNVKD